MKNKTSNPPVMLTAVALAERWDVPVRTLNRWRYQGTGPAYTKLGGAIRYPVAVIEAYEVANMSEQPA